MKTVCAKDMCAGCMACINMCKKSAITIVDDYKTYNAVIDEVKCVNCGWCNENLWLYNRSKETGTRS